MLRAGQYVREFQFPANFYTGVMAVYTRRPEYAGGWVHPSAGRVLGAETTKSAGAGPAASRSRRYSGGGRGECEQNLAKTIQNAFHLDRGPFATSGSLYAFGVEARRDLPQ